MDNYSKIYWLTRLDSLQAFFTVFLVLSFIALLFYYLIMYNECYDADDRKEYTGSYGIVKKISVPLFIVCSLAVVFLPSKSDMMLIYAGGKTMDYVEKDTSLQKIPFQTTTIITEYLDKKIDELKDK